MGRTTSHRRKRTSSRRHRIGGDGDTHIVLNTKLRGHGKHLTSLSDLKKTGVVSNSTTHKLFRGMLSLPPKERAKAISSFPRKYRALDTHQDELVSTATMRSLMQGVLESNPSPQIHEGVTNLFSEVSNVRLPTSMVGFTLKGDRMQHPTGSDYMFGPPKGTGSRHAILDLQRRAAVERAIKEEREKGSDGRTMVHAGLRAGIAFTLNEMSSPATASDIEPNLPRKLTQKEKDLSINRREALKAKFVELGGTQETSTDESRGRKWRTDRSRSDRSVSPRRK